MIIMHLNEKSCHRTTQQDFHSDRAKIKFPFWFLTYTTSLTSTYVLYWDERRFVIPGENINKVSVFVKMSLRSAQFSIYSPQECLLCTSCYQQTKNILHRYRNCQHFHFSTNIYDYGRSNIVQHSWLMYSFSIAQKLNFCFRTSKLIKSTISNYKWVFM